MSTVDLDRIRREHTSETTSVSPIRVLIVTYTGGTGGIAVLLRNLLDRLKDNPEFQFEICFTQQLGVIAEEIRGMGIPVYFLGMKNGYDICRAIPLVTLIRKGKYDLVNFHGLVAIVRFMIALAGAKLILEEHGGIKEEAVRRRKLNPWLHRTLDAWTEAYIAVSDDSRQDLVQKHRVNPSKIAKIYNGIDLRVFNASKYDNSEFRDELLIPRDGIVFGTVRALTYKMGIDHFLRAASIIGPQYPDTYFVIVGDGPERDSLRKLASASPVAARIVFAGARRDIPRVLKSFDVFVLPSVWEALPVSAIESIGMGVPVVAYDVGGTKEVVIDGQTGLLVQNRNPEALARSMQTLYCNEGLRKRLGEGGTRKCRESFDIDKIAMEFGRLFKLHAA